MITSSSPIEMPIMASSSRESVDFSNSLVDASCPACLAMYSDSIPDRMPRLPPLCGHSMCTECIGKVRQCVVCRKPFYGNPSEFRVNYPLMGLVTELQKQGGDVSGVTEACSSCENRARVERLRVCKTCARTAKVDLKKAKKNESEGKEKILEFVYCSDCAIEKHLEKKHDMDKYINYYNKAEMESIGDRVQSDVTAVRDTVTQIGADANTGAQKWIVDAQKACIAGLKLKTSTDCVKLRTKLEAEIAKVSEATDDLLGAQRRYIKKTEESSAELLRIMEELSLIKPKKEKSPSWLARLGMIYRSIRPKPATVTTAESEETQADKDT